MGTGRNRATFQQHLRARLQLHALPCLMHYLFRLTPEGLEIRGASSGTPSKLFMVLGNSEVSNLNLGKKETLIITSGFQFEVTSGFFKSQGLYFVI